MTFGELKVGQQFFFEKFFGGAVCVKVEQVCSFDDYGSYRFANHTLDDTRLSTNAQIVRPA